MGPDCLSDQPSTAVEHPPAGGDILIVRNLSTYASLEMGRRRAVVLDKVNLVVHEHDLIGLVGETGAGKSVLIDSVGRNLAPPLWCEAEEMTLKVGDHLEDLLGKDEDELRRIWGLHIAFIPSNAREQLNPLLTVGRQFGNILQIKLGLSREQAHRKVIEMFERVQMPDPRRNFDSYPHELSGGMAQRVVISIALSMSARLLLADEPTMGLDVTIQAQVLDLIADVQRGLGSGAILATRDLGIVANYCTKVAVMCRGQLMEFAGMREFFKGPRHPYSQYLMQAAFASRGEGVQIEMPDVESRGANETRAESRCAFAERCRLAEQVCRWVSAPEVVLGPSHSVRCHKWEAT